MRICRIIFPIVSAFLLFSCGKELTQGVRHAPKDGSLSIVFNSGKPAAKATAEEEIAAALADGSMFSDLWLWLVRKEGTAEDIRRFVHFTFDATTERVVEFDAVERGNYVLYAVANFTNDRGIFTDYAPVGYTVNDISYLEYDIPSAAKKQLDDNFKKLTLAPLEDGVPPTVHKNGGKMPISLVTEFSVGAGVNRVAAELTRVCGRISVIIRNLSPDYSIAIHDLELSRLNPNTGYLFSHDHSVPGGADFYHEFIPFTKSGDRDYALIAPGSESVVLSQMLYETGEDISLGLSLAGAMLVDGAMNEIMEDNYEFTSEDITKDYYFKLDAAAPSDGTKYLLLPLSSSNPERFLYGNGTAVSLQTLSYDESGKLPDIDERYFWTYSTSNPTLKNVESGKNLGLTTSITFNEQVSYTALSVVKQGSGYNIYRIDGRNYRHLSARNNSLQVVSNRNSSVNSEPYCIWQFFPVETRTITETNVNTNGQAIKYATDAVQIIGNTGTAVPLTSICRNQDLRIVLNISFNPYIGEFEYVILPWNERNVDEIEFN